MITNSLAETYRFFSRAVPEPSRKNLQTQFGVHFEEVAELLQELYADDPELNTLLDKAQKSLEELAEHMKSARASIVIDADKRQLILDALTDQIVTATGSAYMCRMNPIGALDEVNRSNFSKFVDGEPIFDQNKKVMKGPNYTPPDLSPFV